jgi:hypothetical protein
MKKYLALVVLFSITMIAIPAHANYICGGVLTQVGIINNGNIWVAGPGGLPSGVFICQLGATSSNGFTPDSCKAAYATLLSAWLTGIQVSIYFNDSLTCATQPVWVGNTGLYAVQPS